MKSRVVIALVLLVNIGFAESFAPFGSGTSPYMRRHENHTIPKFFLSNEAAHINTSEELIETQRDAEINAGKLQLALTHNLMNAFIPAVDFTSASFETVSDYLNDSQLEKTKEDYINLISGGFISEKEFNLFKQSDQQALKLMDIDPKLKERLDKMITEINYNEVRNESTTKISHTEYKQQTIIKIERFHEQRFANIEANLKRLTDTIQQKKNDNELLSSVNNQKNIQSSVNQMGQLVTYLAAQESQDLAQMMDLGLKSYNAYSQFTQTLMQAQMSQNAQIAGMMTAGAYAGLTMASINIATGLMNRKKKDNSQKIWKQLFENLRSISKQISDLQTIVLVQFENQNNILIDGFKSVLAEIHNNRLEIKEIKSIALNLEDKLELILHKIEQSTLDDMIAQSDEVNRQFDAMIYDCAPEEFDNKLCNRQINKLLGHITDTALIFSDRKLSRSNSREELIVAFDTYVSPYNPESYGQNLGLARKLNDRTIRDTPSLYYYDALIYLLKSYSKNERFKLNRHNNSYFERIGRSLKSITENFDFHPIFQDAYESIRKAQFMAYNTLNSNLKEEFGVNQFNLNQAPYNLNEKQLKILMGKSLLNESELNFLPSNSMDNLKEASSKLYKRTLKNVPRCNPSQQNLPQNINIQSHLPIELLALLSSKTQAVSLCYDAKFITRKYNLNKSQIMQSAQTTFNSIHMKLGKIATKQRADGKPYISIVHKGKKEIFYEFQSPTLYIKINEKQYPYLTADKNKFYISRHKKIIGYKSLGEYNSSSETLSLLKQNYIHVDNNNLLKLYIQYGINDPYTQMLEAIKPKRISWKRNKKLETKVLKEIRVISQMILGDTLKQINTSAEIINAIGNLKYSAYYEFLTKGEEIFSSPERLFAFNMATAYAKFNEKSLLQLYFVAPLFSEKRIAELETNPKKTRFPKPFAKKFSSPLVLESGFVLKKEKFDLRQPHDLKEKSYIDDYIHYKALNFIYYLTNFASDTKYSSYQDVNKTYTISLSLVHCKHINFGEEFKYYSSVVSAVNANHAIDKAIEKFRTKDNIEIDKSKENKLCFRVSEV